MVRFFAALHNGQSEPAPEGIVIMVTGITRKQYSLKTDISQLIVLKVIDNNSLDKRKKDKKCSNVSS